MKITGIKSMKIQGVPWTWTLVKVETDEGICGIGEAQLPIGVADVLRRIEPIIAGEDPRQVIPLAQRIYRSLSGSGSTGGSIVLALSGVELALWDLHGKITGLPLWQLLGGKYRDRVRIYADTGRPGDRSPEAYGDAVLERVEGGYSVVKVDIDNCAPPEFRTDPHNRALSRREVDYMSAVSHAAYQALPDHAELCLDLHWCYQTADALRVARRLEDIDILWLEDPTPPEDLGRGPEVRHRPHLGADRLRREPLDEPRPPAHDRAPGGRHHHPGHPPLRGHPGGPQGGRAVRAAPPRLRAPQHLHAGGHGGLRPRVRQRPQLPGPRAPRPRLPLVGRHRRRLGRPRRRRRSHHGARPSWASGWS